MMARARVCARVCLCVCVCVRVRAHVVRRSWSTVTAASSTGADESVAAAPMIEIASDGGCPQLLMR